MLVPDRRVAHPDIVVEIMMAEQRNVAFEAGSSLPNPLDGLRLAFASRWGE